MKNVFGFIFIIVMNILLLTGCSSDSATENDIAIIKGEVISVSDYSFTLAGQPAVTISFGPAQNKYASFTILKKNLMNAFSVSSSSGTSKGKVDLVGTYNNQRYYLNGQGNTFINVKIKSFDKVKNVANIYVQAKISNVDGSSSIEIDQDIIIDGNNFLNLNKSF